MSVADQSGDRLAWFDSQIGRKISDALLGLLLLFAGTLPIWDARSSSAEAWLLLDSGLFAAVIGVALLAVSIVLLVRAALFRRPQPPPWGVRNVAIVIAAFVLLLVASWNWGLELMLYAGPPDHAGRFVLTLVCAVAVARWSRLRALGMMLLGLLLGAVGMDPITGQLRMTFGFENLNPGFSTILVAVGILVAAEGLACLFSPALWIASYRWINPAWRNPSPGLVVAIVQRIVGAVLVGAACYFAIIYSGRLWDVGLVLVLGIFGAVCKLFGWNRLVLVAGCTYSDALEQSLRQTMLITQGDFTLLLVNPATAAVWLASIVVIALTLALAARGRWRRPRTGAPA